MFLSLWQKDAAVGLVCPPHLGLEGYCEPLVWVCPGALLALGVLGGLPSVRCGYC